MNVYEKLLVAIGVIAVGCVFGIILSASYRFKETDKQYQIAQEKLMAECVADGKKRYECVALLFRGWRR